MEENHEVGGLKKNKQVDSIFSLFSNLTGENNENPKYCLELVQSLLRTDFNVGSKSSLEYSVKRIVRGLGSNKLHSQCGCFAALTCILKYQVCSVEDVLGILDKEQQPGIGVTKAEMRAFNTGCVLACGAIIHSGNFETLATDTQKTVLVKLLDAGRKKSYFSSVIYGMLVDAVKSLESDQFEEVVWPVLKSDFLKNLQNFDADASHFWLVCINKNSKKVRKFLTKISSSVSLIIKQLIGSLLNRVVRYDHPIYESIAQVFCSKNNFDVMVWTQLVDENANESLHKDVVLITLFHHMLKNLTDPKVIPDLLVPKVIVIIMKILSSKNSKVGKEDGGFSETKSALNNLTSLLTDGSISYETRFSCIKKLLLYPGNMKFEIKTGTKCIHLLTSHLNEEFVKRLCKIYKGVVSGKLKKKIDEEGNEESWNFKEQQQALHILTKTLNHPTLKKETSWKLEQVKFLFDVGFLKKFQLSSEVHKCGRDCFYKAIMVQMSSLKDLVTMLDDLALHVDKNVKNKNLIISQEVEELWNKTYSAIQSLRKQTDDKLFIAVHVLLMYMGLYLFLDSKLAKGCIEELLSCYSHLKEVQKKKLENDDDDDDDGPHWTEVTVDLILSLLSRENRLWRHVVSCAFPQVAPHLTPGALHQIIEALDPKSQSSVLRHVDSDDSESEEENEKESESNTDDDDGDDDDDDEDDDDGDEDDDQDNDINPSEQLRSAVRNALGYSAAALTDEESIDMDQMGEEEEKRLNESLGQAFALFRGKSKGKKKKQTKEEEALAHFRLRVLDLIEIYVNNGPTMSGCLDLILPLLDLSEFCVRDHHQRPLQNRLDAIFKQLTSVKNFSDTSGVTQTSLGNVFESVTSKKTIPALVFIEISPKVSDCATFLVRCSQLLPEEDSQIPLLSEYESLLEAFIRSRDFKILAAMIQSVLKINWKGNLKLVETLFACITDPSIRIFKKMKVIELLRIFYKNDKFHSSCDENSVNAINKTEELFIKNLIGLEEQHGNSSEKMYLSFFSNVITLLNLIHLKSKKHGLKSPSRLPWKKVIKVMAGLEVAGANKRVRSQLGNLANAVGIPLPPLQSSERKRTNSESSVQKNGVEDAEISKTVTAKSKKKLSAEKIKLKKESRKMREEISSNGLQEIRFSTIGSHSLPETDPDEEDTDLETKPKKRKIENE